MLKNRWSVLGLAVAGMGLLASGAHSLDVPDQCARMLESNASYRAVISNARYDATSTITLRNQGRTLENRIEASSVRAGEELFSASRIGQRTDPAREWQWAEGHRAFQSGSRVAWSPCPECPVALVKLGRGEASDDRARSHVQSMSVDMMRKVSSAGLVGFSPASGEAGLGLMEGLEMLASNGAVIKFTQGGENAATIEVKLRDNTRLVLEMMELEGFWVPGSATETTPDGAPRRRTIISYGTGDGFPLPATVVEVGYSASAHARPSEKWRMETTFENVSVSGNESDGSGLFARFVPPGGTHALVEEYDGTSSVPGVAPRDSFFLYADGSQAPLTAIPGVEARQ